MGVRSSLAQPSVTTPNLFHLHIVYDFRKNIDIAYDIVYDIVGFRINNCPKTYDIAVFLYIVYDIVRWMYDIVIRYRNTIQYVHKLRTVQKLKISLFLHISYTISYVGRTILYTILYVGRTMSYMISYVGRTIS